jgi:hypothetical protein
MSRFFIKDIDYICTPPSLSIKMSHESKTGSVNILFFDTNKECFSLNYRMSMTDKKEEFDQLLSHVLDNLINHLTKKEFQELILDGELLGLSFHMRLKTVKNKSGKAIWTRH